MKYLSRLVFILVPIMLCSCSTIQGFLKRSEFKSQVVYHKHVVKHSGETLAAISGWYTGKSQNWVMIQSHNPELDIHNIRLGQLILIPAHTLKRQQAMPLSYINRWNGKAKKAPVIITHRSVTNNFSPTRHPSAKPVSYQYNVQSISGCEAYANTALGLDLCAQQMNGELKRIVPVKDRDNEYY